MDTWGKTPLECRRENRGSLKINFQKEKIDVITFNIVTCPEEEFVEQDYVNLVDYCLTNE